MEGKGFFGTLFDFSFSEFVAIKVIKLLYVLGVLLAAFGAISVIVKSFASSTLTGVIVLIISPLIFLLYLILIRIWLEVLIVIFRIADNIKEIAEHTGQKSAQ